MKTMMITILAIEDDEAVAECQAEIDLTTYEITELTDETFISATDETYEGFAIEIDGKTYPVSVDYMDNGNEFMLMDAEGIDALNQFASENPDLVDGEEYVLTDEDFADE